MASVDPEATAAGLRVLRDGGNAVDAAVATAAALGVTEPYSAGIGGGGYFVYYDAKTRRVQTIDGRETAPAEHARDRVHRPEHRAALSVRAAGHQRQVGRRPGHPGHLGARPAALGAEVARVRTCSRRSGSPAAGSWWTRRSAARPCRTRTGSPRSPPTAKLYLPGGDAPAVGSIFRNPELADTYQAIAQGGAQVMYRGPIADEIVQTVQQPPKTAGTTLPVLARVPDDLGPDGVQGPRPGTDRGPLPEPGRVRDGALVVGRHHRR